MSKQARADRHRLLIELLGEGLAATQEEIVGRLGEEGFSVTQATISRDLEELGAVRTHVDDRITYSLPERNGPPAGVGQRIFGELVLDVVSSGSLIVVKTFPGMASTVAAIIDQADPAEVVGTVAGDDTVLCVVAEGCPPGRAVVAIEHLGES